MDLLSLTKSKTRQKIFDLFFSHPGRDYYLREIEKELSLSAGNIRRELFILLKSDLFQKYKKGRLIYYHLNDKSAVYKALKILMEENASFKRDIVTDGFSWISRPSPSIISQDLYCPTRDVFQVRLESLGRQLEKDIGQEAYLVTAVAGEIGNNSFDHNLGNWLDIPGVFFGTDSEKRIIVLADRGQGVFTTISRVVPNVKNDKEALKIAFTKYISGRSPEKRGNGLKFVREIIKDRSWNLRFDSGRASLKIGPKGIMVIEDMNKNIKGTFSVLEY